MHDEIQVMRGQLISGLELDLTLIIYIYIKSLFLILNNDIFMGITDRECFAN